MKKRFDILKSRLYARADYSALLATKKLMGFALSYRELEKIEISSGALCVFDAYDRSGVKPFLQKFPAVECTPYSLSVPTSIGNRIAYAGLKLSPGEAVEWKLALFEEKDVLKLIQDTDSVVSVIDSGIVCFGDYLAMREYDTVSKSVSEDDEQPMDRVVKFDGCTSLIFTLDEKFSFAVFSSGWGDGNYSCYIGYGADGKPVNIICDFNMIEMPKIAESSETVPYTFDIGVEQLYQNDPRLSVDENNLAKWSLVIENKAEIDTATLYKAYSRRGYALHNLGRFEQALEDYYNALEIVENVKRESGVRAHEWSLYDNAGTINKELGNLEEAKRLFEKAKAVGDSFYSGAFINLIDIYAAEKNYAKALAVCDEMVISRPSDPAAFVKRAELLVAMENYEKAITDYDILIRNFQWEEGILEKTSCLASMARYDEALECLEDYVVDNKPNDFYYYNKGFLEYKRHNYKKSYDFLLMAYEYNPEFTPALHLLIEIDDLALDFEKAAYWAGKYIELRPDSEFGYNLRATSFMKSKNYEKAIADYEYIIQNIANNVLYYHALIKAYIFSRELSKAQKLVKKLKKIDAAAFDNGWGHMLLAKCKFAAAGKFFASALNAARNEEYAVDYIDYLIKISDYNAAERNIEELGKIAPDSALPVLYRIKLSKKLSNENYFELEKAYFDKFLPGIEDSDMILAVSERLKKEVIY